MTSSLWTRLAAGAVLFAMAVTMIVLGPPRQQAVAADEPTDSAVTVTGRPGKYDDFSDLEVTVWQTKNLTGEGVTITWTGGEPTPPRGFARNHLAIMQCWGAPDDPNLRETCQFGAELTHPPRSSVSGSRIVAASLDPDETHERIPVEWNDEDVPVNWTDSLPFRASYGGEYIDALMTGQPPRPRPAPEGYEGLIIDLFNVFSTNEQPWLATGGNGEGRTEFWMQTQKEAPHLGCGRVTEEEPTPRTCSLVIVPIGAYDANGILMPEGGTGGRSALSASNWANRLVVPLEFEPVGGFCPLGAQERRTVGTELVSEVVSSWQPALCADGGPVYGYAATGDIEAANQLLGGQIGAPGMAFSIDAIHGESEDSPEIVHAPMALSGITIAFSIDFEPMLLPPPNIAALWGTQVPELNLTPRLVAKLLTQSYQGDIPGGAGGGVEYLSSGEGVENPIYITYDPEFRDYNPIFENFPAIASGPRGLMVMGGNAATIRELWRWVIADPVAREWLEGTPDEHGMIVNPTYADLDLTAAPLPYFPKADPTCVKNPPDASVPVCGFDLRPYQNTLADIALRVLRADVGERVFYDDQKLPPGFVTSAPRVVGKRWSIGVTETASTARYGMLTASLLNRAGEFVAPTTESLLAGVETMRDTDDDGVLEIDPDAMDPDAYPLPMLTYAAVNSEQEPQALLEYANFLAYAATDGQEPGTLRGQLPEGYAPLPDDLRAQTALAAIYLALLSEPTPTPTPTPTSTPTPAPSNTPPPNNAGNSPSPTQSSPPPNTSGPTSPPPAPAATPTPTPTPTGSQMPVAQASTPGTDAGIAPYVLLVALLIGAAAAVAGPALTRLGSRLTGKP